MIDRDCPCNRIETAIWIATLLSLLAASGVHPPLVLRDRCACRTPGTVSNLTQTPNWHGRRDRPMRENVPEWTGRTLESAPETAVLHPWLRPGFSGIFQAQAGQKLPPRNFHISTSHCISMQNMLLLNEYSTKRRAFYEPAPP
ncbi:hypothetical protein [Mesorhizobium dulcispinae]|uniref:hypothetical protein n=1 Tax=Mesorhizobium dulcispinae TaxID=3072316 RepID=UPI002A2466F2|nr:hypothetical protein [Mesorhizobium sp. VK23D]